MSGKKLKPFQQAPAPLAGRPHNFIVHLVPTRPIVYVHNTWTDAEKMTIYNALKQITDDWLTMSLGPFAPLLAVYSDGSGTGASNRKTGETILRGLQHPTLKVIIAPDTRGSFLPETFPPNGNDIVVSLPFSNGTIPPIACFVNTPVTTYGHPSGQPGHSTLVQVTEAPLFITLAHELVHAFHHVHGSASSGSKRHSFADEFGNQYEQLVFTEELVTVGLEGGEPLTENTVRTEQGLSPRAAYASPSFALDQQSVTPPTPAPSWWPNYPKKPSSP